jgi:hypothetical protein
VHRLRPDFSWIDLPVFDGDTEPVQRGGWSLPGLACTSSSSGQINGVGRDAEHVAKAIAARVRGDRTPRERVPA